MLQQNASSVTGYFKHAALYGKLCRFRIFCYNHTYYAAFKRRHKWHMSTEDGHFPTFPRSRERDRLSLKKRLPYFADENVHITLPLPDR